MSDVISVSQLAAPPARPDDSHKGTFGTVVVVGGCATMIGAPAICARAAFRGGAGLVKIAANEKVLPHVLTIEPHATGVVLKGEVVEQVRSIRQADTGHRAVLAVGPGLGDSQDARRLVRMLIDLDMPLVLDADGLNHLAAAGVRVTHRDQPRVLTPHPGEFERLAKPLGITASAIDETTRPEAATALAQAHDAVVVLKGHHTLVTDGKRLYTNATGNPVLATGGSGDVLTGLIAALMAQHFDAFNAACLAVHAHGLAGDKWLAQHGRSGMRATEIADLVPDVFEQLRG